MSRNTVLGRSAGILALVLALAGCSGERPVNPASFNQSGSMAYPTPQPQGNISTTPVR